MNTKTERLRHLYAWNSSYATMTPTAPNKYKYPDGIVLTLKTTNHSEHYFVERTLALQLANSIKESLITKKPKTHQKAAAEKQPSKHAKKAISKAKIRPD